MPSCPAYSSDLPTSTVTYTVHSLPPVALSLGPLPSVSASKAQAVVPLPVVNPSTPPAPVVTQPQVVLVKQFQPPKPYSGASSWKGYREYFERLAAVNGWTRKQSNWPWHSKVRQVRYSGI